MKIRYVCHAGQETGYGRAATELALALVEAGVELQIVPINPSLSSFMHGPQARLIGRVNRPLSGRPDVTIVHTMPLDCGEALLPVIEESGKWEPLIAYTTWEGVDVPPAVSEALLAEEPFDDVWVPSTATQDAFLNGDVPRGVFVLPHTYTQDERPIARRGDEGVFRFCYIGAWTTRKNPHGLIRAFAATFTPADAVELMIHSPGVSVEMFTAARVATGLEQHDMPIVRLSNEHLSDDTMRQMHHQYDCFVTATRGEAWNLPAFEAMLAGRMVIAPGGMGHDDFLFEDPATLPFAGEDSITSARRVASFEQPSFVDVRSVERGALGQQVALLFSTFGAQGLSSKTRWRDPDLVHLGHQMRSVYEARERDIRVEYSPADRFGHRVVAEKAIARIEHLLKKKG